MTTCSRSRGSPQMHHETNQRKIKKEVSDTRFPFTVHLPVTVLPVSSFADHVHALFLHPPKRCYLFHYGMENRIVEMWKKRESGISSLSAISAHLRIAVQHIATGVFGFCLCFFFFAMLRSRSVSAGGSDFYQVILFLVSFFFSFLIVIMGGALVFF